MPPQAPPPTPAVALRPASAPPAAAAGPAAAPPSRPRSLGSVPIKPAPAATSDEAPPGPSDDQEAAAERAADARLARVHLRGGLLTLARAALEQMAGAGTLDREAMADLAEVRWRSGDLEGAADAARAHQTSGGTEPLATLILAEDLARAGKDTEAGELATAVEDRVGGAIDILFALEPRASIWPAADAGAMTVDAAAPGHWGLLAGGSEVAEPTSATWELMPIIQSVADSHEGATDTVATLPQGRGGAGGPAGASTTAAVVMSGRLAGEELDRVERAIAGGDVAGASQRLGVLLRLDPALAPVILSEADRAAASAAPGSRDLSAIHLVRGDAYRSLGRDIEAKAAYQQAHQALSGGPMPEEST